jgi:hypothetical protein
MSVKGGVDMRLEIGNFYVKDIIFGDRTSFNEGILSINKQEALETVREDSHITEADIVIAKPGSNVRIVPVKDAIEPRYKLNGGQLFPGATGKLENAGEGRLHALKNSCVLVVGKHWGGFQDGLVDMGGPGAKYTHFSKLINICLVADTDEEFERMEQQKKNHALRWAGMRLAEYIAKCVSDLEPDEYELFDLPPITKRAPELYNLPGVVYVLQLQSQMEDRGYNALAYGWDSNHMLPVLMHPNEILDGSIISGSFMPSSSKFSTYDHQNNPTIKRLYAEHGKTINFLGVITTNLNVNLEEKTRSAILVAQLAKNLGAQGAIIAEEGYGNPDADFIQCIVELENAGIKTVGLTNECTGRDGTSQPLVVLDQRADAIVSTGNVSEIVELPPMETIIGDLESLARDGFAGGWEGCVREDGSIVMENNSMFCGDGISGFSTKTVVEY